MTTLWGSTPPLSLRGVEIDFVSLTRQLVQRWTGDQYGFALDHPDDVAAVTVGNVIHVNRNYVRSRIADDDLMGMMAHEAAHVVQAYPPGVCVWLKEGLADYVRYYVLRPSDPGRRFDPRQARFDDGYAATAGLLDWSERRTRGVIVHVNQVMHRGGDGLAAFEAVTGKKVGALWASYLASEPVDRR